MIRKKAKLTIPQYRERKEIIEAIGYKEINYIEKGYYAKITLEIDENEPHYQELHELEKKPITIDVLNTRVDTARDLVLKLYSRTNEILKYARMSEAAIVYGNRYRSSLSELNKHLNTSEQLFYKGEYKKSLANTVNILKTIDPSITNRLSRLNLEN